MRMYLSKQTLINLFKLNDIQRQALPNEIKCLTAKLGEQKDQPHAFLNAKRDIG